jgi:hypothetical protein
MGEASEEAAQDKSDGPKGDKSELFVGQHGPLIWREGMEIGNPMRDGLSAFYSFCLLLKYLCFRLFQYMSLLQFLC